MVRRSSMILVLILAAGCGNFTEKASSTLATTLAATNSARDEFIKWDKQHQLDLVDKAKTRTEAEEGLKAYRKKRQKIVQSFTIAYSAIAGAAAILPLVEDGKKPKEDLAKLLVDAVNAFRVAMDIYKDVREAFDDVGGLPSPPEPSRPKEVSASHADDSIPGKPDMPSIPDPANAKPANAPAEPSP